MFRVFLIALCVCLSGCDSSDDKSNNRQGPPVRDDGASCVTGEQCDNTACRMGWPDGYCTSQCSDDDACSGDDAFCVRSVDGGQCMDGCESEAECRPGYLCVQTVSGHAACVPESEVESIPADNGWLDLAVEKDCSPTMDGNEFRFDFSIVGEGGAFITIFNTQGTARPTSLSRADQVLDFTTDYVHHSGEPNPLLFGAAAEITDHRSYGLPYAEQFSAFATRGDYELVGVSTGSVPCLTISEPDSQGSELFINVYSVVEFSDIEDDFVEAVQIANEAFSVGGFQIVTRLEVFPENLRDQFLRIETDQVSALTSLGDVNSGLSIDLFIVEDLVGAFGVSGGLPGSPGMHGQRGNGVVLSALDLGTDNRAFGLTLAHELSHYLGLLHTSEGARGTPEGDLLPFEVDPIEDTAECPSPSTMNRACPDATNLMFPFAFYDLPNSGSLSAEQRLILKVNPLIR